MLYQLSYGTNVAFCFASAKVGLFLLLTKLLPTFFVGKMKKGEEKVISQSFGGKVEAYR